MNEVKITNKDKGQRIDKFIRKYLNDAPLSFIYKLFRKKDIKVNGKRVDINYIIEENDIIQIYLKEDSSLEMETAQIKGVSSSIRNTYAELDENAKLVIVEKVMTHDEQFAKTNFNVKLNGKKSSVKVTSRTVAIDNSKQEFISNIEGNTECYAHVECDAIIKDNATSSSTPQISANHVDAELVHEAYIGKIAGEQLIKLMTLGLSKEEAEEIIINGFLK